MRTPTFSEKLGTARKLAAEAQAQLDTVPGDKQDARDFAIDRLRRALLILVDAVEASQRTAAAAAREASVLANGGKPD